MHRQGYGWYPHHDQVRGRILQHIRTIQPPFGLILTEDHAPISEAYAAYPHPVCARVWAIDDGPSHSELYALQRNPEAAAVDLMQRYLDKRAEWYASAGDKPMPSHYDLFGHAWNEPNGVCDDATIVRGTKALLRLSIQHKFPMLVLNISVGCPEAWDAYADDELERLINDSGSIVGLHGYWQAEGPHHNWTDETGTLRMDYPWLAGRHHWLPIDVPIVISECGVDGGIFGRNPGCGWGYYDISAQEYATQLLTNHQGLDERVVAQCPFGLDYQNKEWATFDYVPVLDHIEEWVARVDAEIPATQNTVHVPVVVNEPDNFRRTMEFIYRWEGGYQADPHDRGNWYDGQLIGTNKGISAATWGGTYDIANLTDAEIDNIYRQHYWLASGADKLDWPACLLVMDTAVLHGVGTALAWSKESGNNPYAIAARRLSNYTADNNWHFYGAGWVNRVADLLGEVGKA